jgi:hypothetical protein
VDNGYNGERTLTTAREYQVDIQTRELISSFSHFLETYDRDPPFKKFGQLPCHVKTIEIRMALGTGQKAAVDQNFCQSLYQTLQAWGIGQRASKLVPYETFVQEMQSLASEIGEFDGLQIDSPESAVRKTASRLWSLINSLRIVENKAKMVAGSKALHHLLPDLIAPIDREYTRRFFRYHTPQFQGYNASQGPVFIDVFTTFSKIARSVPLGSFVRTPGHPWRTSHTKVIDNAVVGFCIEKNLPLPS